MPPRPAFFEFGTRNFVCNSCLSALRKRSPVTPSLWIRHSSEAAHAHAPKRAKPRSPEQEAERRKTLAALGLLKKGSSEKPTVNFFNQSETGEIHQVADEQEFSRSLNDPGGEIDSRLKELEEHILSVSDIADDFKKMGDKAEDAEEEGGEGEADKRGQQSTQDTGTNADDLVDELDNESGSFLAIPIFGLQGNRQDRVHRLNNWLRRCNKLLGRNDIRPKDIQGLWKAYSSARPNMSRRWHAVPAASWDVLWRTLSADHSFNVNRMAHIYVLAKDMQQCNVPLRPDQQLLTLEAMFEDGWHEEAIDNHRRHVSTLGANPETFVAFWQLGLQMYCRVGDLQRAERMAGIILESPHDVDPRFVQPLIKLCAETPTAVETGFKLYRGLRARLGDSMTIEDYDKIISYFLASGNTEHALFIFVDMMMSGSIDLVGAKQYPPNIANPFFFGKWLKRLIGTGDLEGALGVLRFMRSRGVTPRPIQVNGLIGAWLRSGTADNVEKAEDVGWAMINTRIQFVELRRRQASTPSIHLYPSGDSWPRASLETFCLLAENYKERGLSAKMTSLWHSFQDAEIAPDSFMLNQLLSSLVQDGKADIILPTYQEMIRRFDMKPDSHTFLSLWRALPVNQFTKIQPPNIETEISRTRALFAEMVRQAANIKANRDPDMDNGVARNILHSFRKLSDQAGLLLAYRVLRRVFDYSPPDMVVFEILLGTLGLERLARRREGSKLIQARMNLDHYLAHRHRELVQAGEINDGEEMPPYVRINEAGNFLELQLEAIFAENEGENAQRLAIEAAVEMGLQSEASAED
ncbi:hypothetical protein F4777DRAFT_544986 [Nemania sp. FL0916]|nr:hypothetical protein F4777DRAFT_544986 [Nemania sp. FL0916]